MTAGPGSCRRGVTVLSSGRDSRCRQGVTVLSSARDTGPSSFLLLLLLLFLLLLKRILEGDLD
jgi:hypothetical protein